MATFECNGKTGYIPDNLKQQLDTKIFPDLAKKDKDVVFIVDGRERSGKSTFTQSLGAYASVQLKTIFNLSNICMTPEEFRNKVMTADKNQVVIYDEAHRGMGSRRALSEINNILIDLMMEMGQKNLFVIVVLPTFFMLDRYPALFRAKGLFHIYEKKRQRGFWVYFNEKKKKELFIKGKKLLDYNCMHWPRFRGRFTNQWFVDEAEYKEKKAKSFYDKPRITKAETFRDQRNKLIYCLSKETGFNQTELTKIIKQYGVPLDRTSINEILREMSRFEVEKAEESVGVDN